MNAAPAQRSITLTVRPRLAPSVEAHAFTADTAQQAIERVLAADIANMQEPIVEWSSSDKVRLVAADLDVPEGGIPIRDEEVLDFFPHNLPTPAVAYRTHGGGLRAMFVEVDGIAATTLLAAWYLFAPLGKYELYPFEVKSDSRHPAGLRDGFGCGTVWRLSPSSHLELRQEFVPQVDTLSVGQYLARKRLQMGRNPTSACTSCGHRKASGNAAVSIDEKGIYCHRCKVRQPWPVVLGAAVHDAWHLAARKLVHLPHQQYVIQQQRPQFPSELLQQTWRFVLTAVNHQRLTEGSEKEREQWGAQVERAAGWALDVVRGRDTWLNSATLEPRDVTKHFTLKSMPYCRSPQRIDAAANPGPLPGFVPIVPLAHSSVVVFPPTDAVVARKPRRCDEAPPPDPNRKPTALEVKQACVALSERLPGLNLAYLFMLLLASLASESPRSTPYIIVVSGPTGSGKTAHTRLAAAMLGREVGNIQLDETEKTLRQIGQSVQQGRTPLVIDEVGRAKNADAHLQSLLQLNTTLTYRSLYKNEETVPMTAPLVLASSILPRAILHSPELDRRAVAIALAGLARMDGCGNLAHARGEKTLRPHLDMLTSYCVWLIRELPRNFDLRECLRSFPGAGRLSQLDRDVGEIEQRDSALSQLYALYCTAEDAHLSQEAKSRGWLTKQTPGAAALLDALIDPDAHMSEQRTVTQDLTRMSIDAILRIPNLHLRVLLQHRKGEWRLKFAPRGYMRGREPQRRSWPRCPETLSYTKAIPDAPVGLRENVNDIDVILDKLSNWQNLGPLLSTHTEVINEVQVSLWNNVENDEVPTQSYQAENMVTVIAEAEKGSSGMRLLLRWVGLETPKPATPITKGMETILLAGVTVTSSDVETVKALWAQLGWAAPTEWVQVEDVCALSNYPRQFDGPLPTWADALPSLFTRVLRTEQLSQAVHGWIQVDREARLAHQSINERGFMLDRPLMMGALKAIQEEAVYMEQQLEISASTLHSPNGFKKYAEKNGRVLTSLRRQDLKPLEHDTTLPAPFRLAIQARLRDTSPISARLKAGLQNASPDGRVRGSFLFASTTTGRWSATGYQPQNLPKSRGVEANIVEAACLAATQGDAHSLRNIASQNNMTFRELVQSLLRRCIVAPPGLWLARLDFRQIEARVMAWVADDRATLAHFQENYDPYVAFMERLLEPAASIGPELRAFGKRAVLGFGYGMSSATFARQLYSDGITLPAGVTADQVHEAWEAANPAIVGTLDSAGSRIGGLWNGIEDAVSRAWTTGDQVMTAHCTFARSGDYLFCTLPSGRPLLYRGLQTAPSLSWETPEGTRQDLWGAKLTQHIVQAIARDLLANALVELERAQHRTVLHVHDEVVLEVRDWPEVQACWHILVTPPSWAPDLPLDAAADWGSRYE